MSARARLIFLLTRYEGNNEKPKFVQKIFGVKYLNALLEKMSASYFVPVCFPDRFYYNPTQQICVD